MAVFKSLPEKEKADRRRMGLLRLWAFRPSAGYTTFQLPLSAGAGSACSIPTTTYFLMSANDHPLGERRTLLHLTERRMRQHF